MNELKNINIEERMHGDIQEHKHSGYDYWHPATRVHSESTSNELPIGHVLVGSVGTIEHNTWYHQEEQAKQKPRGLQVKPFDWTAWDAGCHAKGICQGYASTLTIATDCAIHDRGQPCPGWSQESNVCIHSSKPCAKNELHHRGVAPEFQGIAEVYWQCPHCKTLQKPIQWAQGARLETYHIAQRGHRTILWLKVSSGQWFVLIAARSIQIIAGDECGLQGTAYAVGNYPPQQLPDEIAVCLARRFWYKITKGFWSDKKSEEEERD